MTKNNHKVGLQGSKLYPGSCPGWTAGKNLSQYGSLFWNTSEYSCPWIVSPSLLAKAFYCWLELQDKLLQCKYKFVCLPCVHSRRQDPHNCVSTKMCASVSYIPVDRTLSGSSLDFRFSVNSFFLWRQFRSLQEFTSQTLDFISPCRFLHIFSTSK